MQVRKVKKYNNYNNGGVFSGTSEYGRRHDRLRRKGHKLQDEALYEHDSTEKGDKKSAKKMKKAQKKFAKARSIRERKDAKSNIRV